jgi:DNA-binding CsgD family transcriptional regulator
VTPHTDQILSLADAGEPVADIAARLSLSAGRVYTILRKHRPDRKRKQRTRTSNKPDQARALMQGGASAARVALLLGVTRQYVYQIGRGK